MCSQFKRAKKTTLLLFLITLVIFTNCGSTKKKNQFRQQILEAQDVSLSELTNLVFVARYENRPVRFTAKFGGISSRWDTPEIDQYKYTHFLASLVGEDGNYSLKKVVIPADEKIPLLKSGDLIEVVGVPHIGSQNYTYIVVLKVDEKQFIKPKFISKKEKD